jgi:hypothetical protein
VWRADPHKLQFTVSKRAPFCLLPLAVPLSFLEQRRELNPEERHAAIRRRGKEKNGAVR